ncbi:MAG: biosynthetic peptidoglycan transglycosylase, partial [Verrucomicrobiota bacterium]
MPPHSSQEDQHQGPFESLYSKTSTRKQRSGCFRGFAILVSLFIVLIAVSVIGGAIYYSVKALAFDMDKIKEVPERTLVYDKEGKLLGHVSGHGANRQVVSADQVSPNFISALLAREDSRFYEHRGIDYVGVLRAVVGNLREKSMDQGASTITMQLARNAFEMREKTLNRKLMEVAIARRIERNYSKDEILAFYMNRIYFGSGLYGIERAAQGYFMKPAAELSLAEAA